MPRRVYTYPGGHGLGHAEPDHHASAPSCSPSACCCSLINVLRQPAPRRASPAPIRGTRRRSNGRSPSPPPPYNFAVIPHGREPPSAVGGSPATGHERRQFDARKAMLLRSRAARRIGTSALDAEPDVILRMPGDRSRPSSCARRWRWCSLGMLLHSLVAVRASLSLRAVQPIAWLWPEPAGPDHGHRPWPQQTPPRKPRSAASPCRWAARAR